MRGSDGTVLAWGNNTWGQPGNSTNVDRRTPGAVPGLKAVTSVAAGYVHSLARRDNGSVVAWGWNEAGQLGDGTMIDSAVSAGPYHSAAIPASGRVVTWGYNDLGAIGDATSVWRLVPAQKGSGPRCGCPSGASTR